MNLTDQRGALESSLDGLILAAASIPASSDSSTVPASVEPATAAAADTPVAREKPKLHVSRPEKNVIAMTIGGVSVTLSPEGVSELIEELSNARASMDVEQPGGLP